MTFFTTELSLFFEGYLFLIIGYAVLIMSSYLILAHLSTKELRKYLKKIVLLIMMYSLQVNLRQAFL
jgi:biofilm PGA synthesis N-glycosyltransferase PgaC